MRGATNALRFINEYLPARAAAGLKPSARDTKATFVAWGNNTFIIPYDSLPKE